MAYPEGFPRAVFSGNTTIYADEPIVGYVLERDYDTDGAHDKWRISVTVAGVEVYNATVWGHEQFDLQGVMLPYLNWEIDFGNSSVIAAGKGELIKQLVFKATNVTDPSVTCNSVLRQVMHARWPKSAGKSLYDYARDNRIFLTHRKVRYVTPDSPEYLTWPKSLSQQGNAIMITPHLKCKVYYSNGSVGIVDKGAVGGDKNIACGFKQLGLDKEANEVDSYEIFLSDDAGFLSEKITFVVDYNSYENSRYLVFRNSLGGFDTMLFTGAFDSSFDVNSTTSINSTNGEVKLKKEGVNVSRVSTAKSGIMPLSDLPYIASEFLTTEKIFLFEGSVITEMLLDDGSYKPSPDNNGVVDFEVSLSAANVGDATFMQMSLAAPEEPSGEVTIVDHNHDNIYYRKDYIDTELGKRALASTVNTLAADMQTLITTVNAHTHSAAQVAFADGETFQQKLDAGKLKGADGKDAYVTVPNLDVATAALYDDGQLANYPAGKIYGGLLCKMFRVSMVNSAKKFLPIGITYVTGDGNGVSVFDPVTEQYIALKTWEQLTGPQGASAYVLDVNLNGYNGTQAEWAAQFADMRQHLANADVHVTLEKKAAWDGIEGRLKGGVAEEGDTLYKLKALIDNLTTFVNGDDVNLDSVKELADYIKANKTLLDQVTTNKVNTSDIVNTLDCIVEGKVLDARQGKALKTLIDNLTNVVGGKLEKGNLPAGITSAQNILEKIGIDQNADLTTLLANTSNALFNALAGASKDTLVEIIKWLIENKIDKQLAKDRVWVGNGEGISEEVEMISPFDQNIPYLGQFKVGAFSIEQNAGTNGTLQYIKVYKSQTISLGVNAVTLLENTVMSKELKILDIQLDILGTAGTAGGVAPTVSLCSNAAGTVVVSNIPWVYWAGIMPKSYDCPIAIPKVNLANGLYLSVSGGIAPLYNNCRLVITGVLIQ